MKTLALIAALILIGSSTFADQGWVAANRIERGQITSVRDVTVSSNTGTALWSASLLRPDGVCRNNSAFTIWLGTVTAQVNGATHTNIVNGFPVLSSETFTLGGQLTSAVYATADTGISSADVRCFDGLVP